MMRYDDWRYRDMLRKRPGRKKPEAVFQGLAAAMRGQGPPRASAYQTLVGIKTSVRKSVL
jgi:hypothetical protein